MKTIIKLIGVIIITISFGSCSAVKITDSWKDENTTNIKNKSIMVVSRTNDDVIRTRFEKDLVSNLNEKGYRSVESYTLFPDSDPNCEVDKEELKQVKQEIQNNGIEVIVVTNLRDTEEYTETVTKGTSYYVNTFPYYGRGFYRGYYRYYGSLHMVSDPVTQVTSHHKKYILETLVYDLTKPEEEQLVYVITTSVENPETLGSVSKDYAKSVVKKLHT
ncbi:hypothetical protein M0D21_04270 [Aquimarina sp. D1M17]|uniref:hypothetical protein n=1 Tax=Aquimarina acroporae TaxID=2937283 RepID=UPI0020C0AB87|nr:hypothetical protein [Aquimarina acroporae]MCK8520764.1 hypothetical protein [Aquimarina acroporae]